MILDVGCGPNPKGDVNCDLFKDYTPEYNPVKKAKVHGENFVCCSGEYLPFQNNMFDSVISIHVIEHCKRPSLFLNELVRVSNLKVLIRCPHRFGKLAKMPYHRVFLNCSWFNRELKGLQFLVTISKYRFASLKIPEEITVKIYKRLNDVEYLFS